MTDSPTNTKPETSGILDQLLTPGSSLHPSFQLLLDGAFLLLLCVFLGLLFLTRGNIHIFALIGIEGCLYASVKWFVAELQKVQSASPHPENAPGDTKKVD